MAAISEVATQFFEACEAGKGWEVCKAYCKPDATFSAQAEPLADGRTLQATAMPDDIINFEAWRDALSACEATDLLRQVLSNARAGCADGELPEGDRNALLSCLLGWRAGVLPGNTPSHIVRGRTLPSPLRCCARCSTWRLKPQRPECSRTTTALASSTQCLSAYPPAGELSERRVIPGRRIGDTTASEATRHSTPTKYVHPLVLAVLHAVWRATATRPPPYYVSVDILGLPPDPECTGAAILQAVLTGYLTAAGNPPHSVAITEDGRRLLKERGMA